MKILMIVLSLCVLHATVAYAEDEGGEVAPKQTEKPHPDSAISTILQLPIVQKWDAWIASKKTEAHLSAWGESIKEVGGSKCWSIAVAEVEGDNTRIWKRFCVQTMGGDIWVESPPADPLDDMKYYSYEKWIKECEPTENSTGKC